MERPSPEPSNPITAMSELESALAAAQAFGIDLTLTLQNLTLTPHERLLKLQRSIHGLDELRRSAHRAARR